MALKILVLDIETTHLKPSQGCIVEIGAVELDLETGEIKEVFDSLCRESTLSAKDRQAWIFSNSDMTVESVRNSRPFAEVAKEFQEVINKYPIGATAFNRLFDFTYLHDRGIRFPKTLPCPMILATDICKLPGNYGDYKYPKVTEAYKFFFPEREYEEKHRGCDDSKHEAEIVYKLYKSGIFKLD